MTEPAAQPEHKVIENAEQYIKIYEHLVPSATSTYRQTHWHAEIKLWRTTITLERIYLTDLVHDLGHLFLALTNEQHHPPETPA